MTRQIKSPEEITRLIVDVLGTAEVCSIWETSEPQLSKYKSSPIDGRDNHRPGPFRRILTALDRIRLKALDGDAYSVDVLNEIGQFFAQKCGGYYISKDMASIINNSLETTQQQFTNAIEILDE